ncbi:MAG: sugar ABC transporter substrate-binding protein [Vicinamibacteria bacterium]|nr:sugar ABC transporter substrate-binding protein [Vicinamibacteria bacterium]
MAERTVGLYLTNPNNDYQQFLRDDALASAKRLGLDIEILFAEQGITQQIQQYYSCIHRRSDRPHSLMIVHPARDGPIRRVAEDAARAGIGFFVLNRLPDCIKPLIRDFAHVPICAVTPDQREIGRIQGRQFLSMLPSGGLILYGQGNTTTVSARERLAAVQETIRGSNIELALIDGDWRTDSAQAAVIAWMRTVMPADVRVALIGCQNDAMAVGAHNALKTLAIELSQPALRALPITGCDGLPNFGQRLVREGQIAATVVVPSTTGPALDLASRYLRDGEMPPAHNFLQPTPFPVVPGSAGMMKY